MAPSPGDVGPDVSVVVVSYGTRELTRRCLASLATLDGRRTHEVVVVDNASTDGSADMVAADFPGAQLIANDQNLGFARGVNLGLDAARGRHVLLLNSDALLEGDVLDRLLAVLDDEPDVGVVGAGLRFPDGRLQPSCGRFPSLGRELLSLVALSDLAGKLGGGQRFPGPFHSFEEHQAARDVDWVAGACFLVRGEVTEQVGPMDGAIFLFGEEWDWCWRIRKAGWRVVHRPEASVVHVGSASMESDGPWRVRALLSAWHYVLGKHRGPAHAVGYKALTAGVSGGKTAVWGLMGLLMLPLPGRRAVCWRRMRWNARSVTWALTPGSQRLIHGPPAMGASS
jgi:GT2 family glycosyltransferase